MRLTKKSDKLGYCLRHSSIKTWQCWDKLGQLEDIEDELGIDLITLFNEEFKKIAKCYIKKERFIYAPLTKEELEK